MHGGQPFSILLGVRIIGGAEQFYNCRFGCLGMFRLVESAAVLLVELAMDFLAGLDSCQRC